MSPFGGREQTRRSPRQNVVVARFETTAGEFAEGVRRLVRLLAATEHGHAVAARPECGPEGLGYDVQHGVPVGRDEVTAVADERARHALAARDRLADSTPAGSAPCDGMCRVAADSDEAAVVLAVLLMLSGITT